MKKNKKFSPLFAAMMCISLLVGCGHQDAPSSPDTQQPSANIESFSETTITSVSALDNKSFVWSEEQLSEMSRLLQDGLQSPLSEEGDTLRENAFWVFSLVTEAGELSANVLAGADPQGIVRLSASNGSSVAIRSQEMAELLLKGLSSEGPVDQQLLTLLQPAIQERIQQYCEANNETTDNTAQYLDGEVVHLEPIYHETGSDGEEYYLFASDVAMICKNPENIQLFDGMWVDSQGRMRDSYQWAYIAAEIKNDTAVHTAFLLGDEVIPDGTDEELRISMMDALSRANTP